MELPSFLGSRKASQRPRPPQDVEFSSTVHHRFSRALGVFLLLKRELGDGRSSVSVELATICREDSLDQLMDAMASDAYRGFIERELGIRYRLELNGKAVLHAASDEGLPKLEADLRERFDRKGMDHGHSFGIATVRLGHSRFLRKKEVVTTYDMPLHDGARELVELRSLMACFPYRDCLQRQLDVGIGFLLPNRLIYTRRARAIETPDLSEQLRLEGVI